MQGVFMNNLKKYNTVFASTFNILEETFNDDFNSEIVNKWDSIIQLTLVTAMEEEFDIMFDPEDILGFKSYKQGKEILAKYNIAIE
jgi:acyl carrier protein